MGAGMRGRTFGVPVLMVAALLLAGCSRPAGTDGDLMDDWPALAAPKPNVPASHACYYNTATTDFMTANKLTSAVDCQVMHNLETFFVGTFAGADGARSTPPPAGGAERRRAFTECTEQAKTFLGGEWHTARLALTMVVPLATQWDGGGRWFRCDISEVYTSAAGAPTRTATLQSALATSGPLALGCYTVTEKGNDATFEDIACTQPHGAEFAGVYEAPDGAYPDDAAREKLRENGCQGVVAAFAGVPNDNNFLYRTGYYFDDVSKTYWELGDRHFGCYIAPKKPIDHSLKGVGPGALPVS